MLVKKLKASKAIDPTLKGNISYDQERALEFSDGFDTWVDEETGLMWEVKTEINWKHEYVWNEEYTEAAWNPETLTDDVKDAFSYAKKLNKQRYGGFDDWRVPNYKELMTLFADNRTNDYYIKVPLSKNLFGYYWSSTTYIYNIHDAWVVSFNSVRQSGHNKGDSYFVRCVRGGQFETLIIEKSLASEKDADYEEIPSPKDKISYDQERAIEFSDGFDTWVDEETGLMWEVKTEINWKHEYVWNEEYTEAAWNPETLTDDVKDAFSYAKKLNKQRYGGFDDWRVPNYKELMTLFADNRTNDYYIKVPLSKNLFNPYWSSITHMNYSSAAWSFCFRQDDTCNCDKRNNYSVRCVRAGEFETLLFNSSF